ncbi:MAG: DUF421 domain-containing protein [Chitinophagaceae bacterium]|nr:DUF421 domain-containing protein [Chitinophagaceae bacterium]
MNLPDWQHIIVSTAMVYLFIVVTLRVLGKSELAQLSVTDLVFVLLISNSVQNAMVGSDTSLMGGLLAATVLFTLNYLFKILRYRFPVFRRAIEGEPVLLVHKGQIIEENCRKNKITTDEIHAAIREHGSSNIADIDLVILEADGNISVVSNNYKHHSTRRIRRRKTE